MVNLPTFTILIVEDLATDRELYKRLLCQESSCVYDLLEAESLITGLALCQTRRIDAVLLDYRLPDGDGLDFLERLSAEKSSGSNPSVVMISGQGNEKTAVQAIKLGAEDYLVKRNLTTELLLAAIRTAIENTRLRWQLQQKAEQAELTLEAKNEQITTIWESMTDAYATLDRDWRIVYTNSAATEIFCQTTGLTPAEYLGKTHWEVFPTAVGTIIEQEYRRAMTDRVAVHFELFFEPTNAWFETHAYPSDAGLGLYFRDISQRKQSELARIAAEQERDRFFDLSLDLLVVANFDQYFLRVNPAFGRILGFTSAEMLAQSYMDLVHPDDREHTLATAQALSKGEAVLSFENRYRCKDGSYRWVLWSANSDIAGQLIYANGHDITDRKRNEEQLRQSEELNRRIIESHRDCLKVVDLAGRVIYMNNYGQSLMEIDDFSTIAGNQWLDCWQGGDRESAQTAFSIALAGGDNQFDGYCPTNKGTPKWWEVTVTPIFAADGQVSQILSVSRDITDRKQAALLLQTQQATIRQQLSEIESIYQMAPVGLCFVNTDFCYVRINEELAQINGLSVAEHIGQNLRAILPEMADRIEPLYAQIMASGEPIIDLEITGSNRAQPGVERCWLASFYPQIDDRGRVVGVNTVVQEITDRKRLEAARLFAEQERDRFFTQSLDMLAIGNFEGYFIRVNPAFERLLGFTETDFLSRPWIDFVHPDDRQSTLAAIQGLANGQIVVDFESRFQCKDGSYIWTSWNSIPYLQSNCWYSVGRDVTDRRQTQADLEARNRELDSFVYVVAHDLKAPLRAVANLSQWIEDDLEGQLTAENQSQMTHLRNRVHRMAATIDGLLEYARIDRSEDKIEPVPVAQLLADVIDSLALPPTFTVSLPAQLPTLCAKRLLLSQVFINLIGNAVKHHDSETGLIQITIVDRGAWYEFAIADDGPGIALEHQARMFQIFQAVNPQNRSDSTGIGLAIVKKIVEAEGGKIWLESELGKGTTFYFTWLQR